MDGAFLRRVGKGRAADHCMYSRGGQFSLDSAANAQAFRVVGRPDACAGLHGNASDVDRVASRFDVRPIRDTLVLMPPLSISPDELRHAVDALSYGIRVVCESTYSDEGKSCQKDGP